MSELFDVQCSFDTLVESRIYLHDFYEIYHINQHIRSKLTGK